MSDTAVLPNAEEKVTEFDGKAHYARIASLMKGGVIVALCGKKYVPRDIAGAKKYPVCAQCQELMEMLAMMYPADAKDL